MLVPARWPRLEGRDPPRPGHQRDCESPRQKCRADHHPLAYPERLLRGARLLKSTAYQREHRSLRFRAERRRDGPDGRLEPREALLQHDLRPNQGLDGRLRDLGLKLRVFY